jgi:hypothetical protein
MAQVQQPYYRTVYSVLYGHSMQPYIPHPSPTVSKMQLFKLFGRDYAYSMADIQAGIHIDYLPPYLPDSNPAKEAFSKIKHWLRHYQDYYG